MHEALPIHHQSHMVYDPILTEEHHVPRPQGLDLDGSGTSSLLPRCARDLHPGAPMGEISEATAIQSPTGLIATITVRGSDLRQGGGNDLRTLDAETTAPPRATPNAQGKQDEQGKRPGPRPPKQLLRHPGGRDNARPGTFPPTAITRARTHRTHLADPPGS